MDLKIATVNLCLGLKNKRVEVERLLVENEIKIIFLQEVEIETGVDPKILKFKNFQFEFETNSEKSRTGMYICNTVYYSRMTGLEGLDSSLIIIDIKGSCSIKRIINVYRSFNPQNNVNPRNKFKYQLE